MIEANILIDRDLIIKGYKRAYGLTALKNGAAYFSSLGFWAFIAVALVDVAFGGAHLIGAHLVAITVLAIAAALYHYFDWVRQVERNAKDYELDVILDDDAVTIKNSDNKRIEWSAYAYFREYEDYLEITDRAGEISFLPKRDEYARAIVFTKTKIPNREF